MDVEVSISFVIIVMTAVNVIVVMKVRNRPLSIELVLLLTHRVSSGVVTPLLVLTVETPVELMPTVVLRFTNSASRQKLLTTVTVYSMSACVVRVSGMAKNCTRTRGTLVALSIRVRLSESRLTGPPRHSLGLRKCRLSLVVDRPAVGLLSNPVIRSRTPGLVIVVDRKFGSEKLQGS